MNVQIERADAGEVRRLFSKEGLTQRESQALDISLALTTDIWLGMYNGKVACAWGLMPPTLLSSVAHMWLYTTEELKGHEFIFIRYSQRVIEVLHAEYPIICGLCDATQERTVRWLQWLGASFGEPRGKYVPFKLRKRAT